MESRKIVATGLIVSLSIAVITAVIEPISEDNWYALAGLGMFVFGIWGAIVLLKNPKLKD